MFDLYMITNKINDKKYIGFTSQGFSKRFLSHVRESKFGGNRLLCRALRKYGEENFEAVLLENVNSHEEAIKREQELIFHHKTFAGDEGSWGYNATRGGEGSIGHTVPLKTRLKLKRLREEEGRWQGENNPNYENRLFKGREHARRGVKISPEGIQRIKESITGRFEGIKHHNAVKQVTYAKNVQTGEIIKKDSFYELRTFLEKEYKIKVNRSSALNVIRGEARSHNGFIFYREDETPKEIFEKISYQYENNIKIPVVIESLNQKETHPNAKNYISFARNINTGELLRFTSWYKCKQYMTENINPKFNYSEMKKCLEGKQNYVRGFIFYREDVTDVNIFKELENEYRSFNDYRKHT